MRGALALAVSAAVLIAAPVAGASNYRNEISLLIPGMGVSSPYGTGITVSGVADPITDVNVGIDNFDHGRSEDVSIALVAPSGEALLLQACGGDSPATVQADLTFDDGAALLPNNGAIPTGTYRPTNHCPHGITFDAPGPADTENPGPGIGGAATFASVFNGLSAIGTWRLFVSDRINSFGGSIWSLVPRHPP